MTDYGIVVATHLVECKEAHSVKMLASETGVPVPTTSKVLKKLSRAKVVQSQRGPLGGYALARAADQISILEVIDALEGPLAVTECSSGVRELSCAQAGSCNVQDNWRLINEAIRSSLASITLAEMSQPARASLVQLARSRAEAVRTRESG